MRAQSKALVALALVALLAGCDTTDSSAPSGAEAPRLSVTVLSGTKSAPVDSPEVKIEWNHEGRVYLTVRTVKKVEDYPGDSIISLFDQPGIGSLTAKFHCLDSFRIVAKAVAKVDTTPSAFSLDTSKTIYCK